MKNLSTPVKCELKTEPYASKPDYDTRLLSSGARTITAASRQEGNLLDFHEHKMLDVLCAQFEHDWQRRAFNCVRLFFSEKHQGDLSQMFR
jgi:hypothetical protein